MAPDNEALIALGSNLGDRAAYLYQAVQALAAIGTVVDTSFLYETEPVLLEDQPRFLNAACRLLTDLAPKDLLKAMQQIETEMGRVKEVRYGPRNIDLDLSFYGDCILNELPFIQLPHYQATLRDFVLEPLCDMVPDFVNPQTGLTLCTELKKLDRPPLRQMLPIGRQVWQLQAKTRVVGILNVSPESRLAPGQIPENAAQMATFRRKVVQMEEEGVDAIDIGAQTSRPQHELIPMEEEVRRLTLAFTAARETTDLPLSADTFRSDAAQAALDCGADMINDVWAGRFDPDITETSANAGKPHVFVHNRLRILDPAYPSNLRNLSSLSVQGDVTDSIRRNLEEILSGARHKGQCRWLQIVDPGLGFGKNMGQNLALLGNLESWRDWKYPVMAGPSRKGFIRELASSDGDSALLAGSLAASVLVSKGAHMVRVHDIAETVSALRTGDAVVRLAKAGLQGNCRREM